MYKYKRCGLIYVLILMCMLFSGCKLNSYDEYYKQMETQYQEHEEQEIDITYDSMTVPGDAVFIENYGESVNSFLDNGNGYIKIRVLGAKVGKDMSTYETIQGYNTEFLEYLDKVNELSVINCDYDVSERTFISPVAGIETNIFFVELELYNPSDKERTVNFTGLDLLEYSSDDNSFKSLNVIDSVFYDKETSYGSDSAMYKIAPGETLSTVWIYVTPEKRITARKNFTDDSGEKKRMVSKTEEYDINSIYLRTDMTGKRELVSGESFVKLNFDE